ncbi:MAG: glycosyltransferase family 4 protein [Armatimonadetes bacterium]|nr:glycosyltransferase family 4 protein [Armatimonadota bacterium]
MTTPSAVPTPNRTRRLRIAIVANGIHQRGGMERASAELVQRIAPHHDVHLFSSDIADIDTGNVTVHHIAPPKKPFLLYFMLFYAQTSRAVRFKDFDIVHTVGGITKRQNFVTAQYCQAAWGKIMDRSPIGLDGLNAYARLMCRVAEKVERDTYGSPDLLGVHSVSSQVRTELHEHYGLPQSKVRVIHNAVNQERFHPDKRAHRAEIRARYGIAEDVPLMVFAGEWRRKGLANIIRAMAKLSPGSSKVHLLAVGRGDEAIYRGLAEAGGVANRVVLAPATPDIEKVLAAGDMFVFPTFYEAFSLVVTEALASGLPVITTQASGTAEVLKNGESGIVLPDPTDITALASAIDALVAATPAERERMGAAARQAVAPLTWDNIAAQIEQFYFDVV